MDLKDKVALVTGSAGLGMGRSIALTLAREGAKVAVNYRTSNNQAQAIVNHIESHSDDAVAVEADVFKADDCKNLVDAVIDHFGRIDICIINPGAGWHPESIDKLDSTVAVEDVQHEVAPFFHLMPLVLPHMYERQWGRVIGIALLPPYDSPAYSYNVGKAARVHALLKGPVAAIESLSGAIEQCERGPAWRERRNTSPQDIAESVAFLCSDAGRFIT
ncbi:MAG: SDR family NAD(P)-dependent oxidoreductase, partial [Planctomycetota bacterium]